MDPLRIPKPARKPAIVRWIFGISRCFAICAAALYIGSSATAQSTQPPESNNNESIQATLDAADSTAWLTWRSVSGRTYFIQYSTDLVNWSYFTIIESGTGGELARQILYSGVLSFFD